MGGNSQRLVILQDRDRRLITELSVMRIIDRELAKVVAGFNSTTRANARLLLLTQAGYLRRNFIGTISGGRKAVYSLSKKSLTTVAILNGVSSGAAARDSFSELFAEHQLRINEIYVTAKHQTIPRDGHQFQRWISFTRPLSASSSIIPDGYFELQTASDTKPFFLEVDMGTEALRVWTKKIEGYLRLAVSGEFKKLFGPERFKVLVTANSEKRAENIRQLTAKFTDKIFRFSSFQNINSEGFWSAIWRRPKADQRESLV